MEASRHRQHEAKYVSVQVAKLRNRHEALLCRWGRGGMDCRRSPTPLFGAPARSRIREDRLAVAIAGMTRSFETAPMIEYWRRLLAAVRVSSREPVLFAALSLESSYNGWPSSSIRLHNATALRATLARLGADFRMSAFTGRTWADAAKRVCHPVLRDALSPPYAKTQSSPGNFGLMRRAIALDLLLQYEVEMGSSFEHVLFVRPDGMTPQLLDANALSRMWTVPDTVILVNDQVAVAPRALAGYYLAASIMNRHLFGMAPELWPAEALKRLHTSLIKPNPGSLVQPTTFLAYHGVMFAGLGLELLPMILPWIDERGLAHALAVEPHPPCANALLRQLEPRIDLAASEGDAGGYSQPVGSPVCMKQRENAANCIRELGGFAGVVGFCEELVARRPKRQEAQGESV